MWEIDELIKKSIFLINHTQIAATEKKNIIWSLENLPQKYDFDAGGYTFTQIDKDFKYEELDPFEIGDILTKNADEYDQPELIYDWSTFLLNFWQEYFSQVKPLTSLKDGELRNIKQRYHNHDFNSYTPIHVTLTMYKAGSEYFSTEQNQLIEWFNN